MPLKEKCSRDNNMTDNRDYKLTSATAAPCGVCNKLICDYSICLDCGRRVCWQRCEAVCKGCNKWRCLVCVDSHRRSGEQKTKT